MTDLWIPTQRPPRVSEAAVTAVSTQLLEEGVATTSNTGLARLHDSQDALGGYLDEFGFDLNCQYPVGLWPERVFKMGASLAFLAYRETGYFQNVDDDKFSISKSLAELEGVPAAYISRLLEDEGLLAIVDTAQSAPDLQMTSGQAGRQVLGLGAGCMRYYLQTAVAA